MIDDETFSPENGNVFILDPGNANRIFDPDGEFMPFTEIKIINTSSEFSMTFDSFGLNIDIAPGERGIFIFDGRDWLKIYVGS